MPVPQNNIDTTPLNPMVFHSRFPDIFEKVFENLSIKDLKNSREVSKSWMQGIDNQNILWHKVAENEDSKKFFQLACKKGHLKMVMVLIQKSVKYKIDLNAKDTVPNDHSRTVTRFPMKMRSL